MTWKRQDWQLRKNQVTKFLADHPKSTLKEISESTNFGLGDTKRILARLRNDKLLKIYPVIHAYSMT
jgi:transcription initiation factor IIE alpha subunit